MDGPSSFLPLGAKIKRHFVEAGISVNEIAPSKVPRYHTYESEENDVSFRLAQYDKSSTSEQFYQCIHWTEIEPQYQNYFKIYTDGSKFQDGKVAYCAFFPDLMNNPKDPNEYHPILAGRIPDNASIFTGFIRATLPLKIDILTLKSKS